MSTLITVAPTGAEHTKAAVPHLPTTLEEKIRVRFETLDGAPDSVRVVKPEGVA